MKKDISDKIIPTIIALALILGYPLVYGRLVGLPVPEWHVFRIFDGSAVGALSITLLLLSGGLWGGFWRKCYFNRVVLIGFIGIVGLEFWRMLRIDSGDLFGSYLYVVGAIALLMIAAIRGAAFGRMLPYLALWFLVTGAWSYFGDYLGGFIGFGIAGNWNWSSALLIATAPVALTVFRHRLYSFNRFGWVYMAGLSGLVLTGLLLCPVISRGTVVATIIAVVAVGLLTLGKKYSAPVAWGTFFVLLIAVMFVGYIEYQSFVDFCKTETRPEVYKIAWKVFVDNPIWGCSWGQFGDAAAAYKGMEYYLRPLASIWSPHAHNEILNLLASGGISGILIVIVGIALIVGAMFAYCKKCTPENGSLLFMLILLVAHGMFDMTLETIPAGFLALLAAGVLWGHLGEESPASNFDKLRRLQVVIRYGATLLFGGLTVLIVISNIYSSYYERLALIHVKAGTHDGALLAIQEYNRASLARPSVDNLYQPIWILIDGFEKYNPDTALAWIRRFEVEFGRTDYRYLKFYRARALLKKSDNLQHEMNPASAVKLRNEALELLSKHTKMYPADFRGLELYREAAQKAKNESHYNTARERSNTAKMFFPDDYADVNALKQRDVTPSVAPGNTVWLEQSINKLFYEISGNARRNWIGVGLLLLGSWGVGIILWRLFGARLDSLLLQSLLELTAGFYLLSVGMLALDKLILANVEYMMLGLGGLGAVALWRVFRIRNSISEYIWKNFILVLTVIGVGGFYFGAVYLPPLAHDELVYQAALLRSWAESGSVDVRLDIPYSAFPSLANFDLLYATVIGGIGAARMTVLAVTTVALLGLGELLRRRAGSWIAAAMILAYMLSGAAWVMATQVQVESFSLLILVGGLALANSNAGSVRTWIMAGALGGMALAVKLTCGLFPIVFLLALWYNSRSDWQTKLRYSVALGVAALVAGGVFFIRPYLATNNVVYPYFAELFSANEVEQFVGMIHHQMGGAKYGYESSFRWFNLIGAGYDQLAFDGLPAGYGYLLLLALGVGLTGYGVFRRDFGKDGVYLASAWMLLLFWGTSAPQTRFLAPAVVLLMFVASGAMGKLGKSWRAFWVIIFIITGVCSMPAKIFWNNCYAFFAVRRQVDLPSAYAKISPYSPAMWQVILNGKYQKSMLIYEERGLYFPIKYVIGTPGFQGEFVAYRDGAAAFEKELIDNGIDSLVIGVGTGPDRVTAASQEYLKMNEVLAGLIKSGRLKIVTQLPDYWVLQLSSAQEKLKKNL